MKFAMITFAAAVGSANAWATPGGTEVDLSNPCMTSCTTWGRDRFEWGECIDNCAAIATLTQNLATANAALATATTCMAATPGYSPVNFEDNCDMKECDQWTCETWCTCYSEADAAIYTRLGCDTVDDAPCQC